MAPLALTAFCFAAACHYVTAGGSCAVKADGTNCNCAAADADQATCLGKSKGTCAVATNGVNGACDGPVNSASCTAATGNEPAANACVFTPTAADACEWTAAAAGTCKVKANGTNTNCAAASADQATCLGKSNGTCAVTSSGTNTAPCETPTDSTSCKAATVSGGSGVCANNCVFTATAADACEWVLSCIVAGLSAPSDGALDGACAAGATLASGASCTLTCNSGYTLSGTQPSCTTGTFNAGTVACTAAGNNNSNTTTNTTVKLEDGARGPTTTTTVKLANGARGPIGASIATGAFGALLVTVLA